MADMGEKLDQASERLERAAKALSGFNSGNQSQISINAGGIGVWIATSCCLIMLFCGLIAAFWVSREFNQMDAQMTTLRNDNDVMRQYLTSIYQQAPWLKRPDEEKQKDSEE